MSEDKKPEEPAPPTSREAAFIAEKMPSWWRPEYQKAAAKPAPTVPPLPAPAPVAAAPAPAPVAPAPAPAPVAPPSAPPAPPPPPASHDAKTMVLSVAPSAPPVAILTVTEGPDKGFKFRVKPAAVTNLGRETDNDVVLDDPATSRHHAQIQFQDGKYVLTDLGSANGTFVKGQRVTALVLGDGDAITLGQNVITVSIAG